jgi:hypothetical protein
MHSVQFCHLSAVLRLPPAGLYDGRAGPLRSGEGDTPYNLHGQLGIDSLVERLGFRYRHALPDFIVVRERRLDKDFR